MNTTLIDLPVDVISSELTKYIDLKSIVNLSLSCKYLYLSLLKESKARKNEIPWRISVEYHFNGLEYFIHKIWVKIGWIDPSYSDDCSQCFFDRWIENVEYDTESLRTVGSYSANGIPIRSRPNSDNFIHTCYSKTYGIENYDVKSTVTSGIGGYFLKQIIKHGKIIPIWLDVNIYSQNITPKYIGNNIPAYQKPDHGAFYCDEIKLTLGPLVNLKKTPDYYFKPDVTDSKKLNTYFNFLDKHRINPYIQNMVKNGNKKDIKPVLLDQTHVRYDGISHEYLVQYDEISESSDMCSSDVFNNHKEYDMFSSNTSDSDRSSNSDDDEYTSDSYNELDLSQEYHGDNWEDSSQYEIWFGGRQHINKKNKLQ